MLQSSIPEVHIQPFDIKPQKRMCRRTLFLYSAEAHNNHLRLVIQPDIDRVGSKPPSDDHPALLFSAFRKFKIPRTARIKELILGRHDSADNRKPDGSAVKMSGKCKICSPVRILLKKQRGVSEKKTEPFGIRFSQSVL